MIPPRTCAILLWIVPGLIGLRHLWRGAGTVAFKALLSLCLLIPVIGPLAYFLIAAMPDKLPPEEIRNKGWRVKMGDYGTRWDSTIERQEEELDALKKQVAKDSEP